MRPDPGRQLAHCEIFWIAFEHVLHRPAPERIRAHGTSSLLRCQGLPAEREGKGLPDVLAVVIHCEGNDRPDSDLRQLYDLLGGPSAEITVRDDGQTGQLLPC